MLLSKKHSYVNKIFIFLAAFVIMIALLMGVGISLYAEKIMMAEIIDLNSSNLKHTADQISWEIYNMISFSKSIAYDSKLIDALVQKKTDSLAYEDLINGYNEKFLNIYNGRQLADVYIFNRF